MPLQASIFTCIIKDFSVLVKIFSESKISAFFDPKKKVFIFTLPFSQKIWYTTLIYLTYNETEKQTMRNRVLTQTNKGKMLAVAGEVSKLIQADKDVDVIMPAYPCDGERLIVIVATAKPTMPDSFQRFMRSLKRSVTANVAFIIDGTPENAAKIVEMAKTGNSNVMEDKILYLAGGLPFRFMKKVTPEESDKVKAWVEEIRAAMV